MRYSHLTPDVKATTKDLSQRAAELEEAVAFFRADRAAPKLTLIPPPQRPELGRSL